MNVSLTPEMEIWVQNKVKSGLYQSSSEVIRESIRLLRERENLVQQMTEELRGDILAGISDIEQKQAVPFTKELIQDVKHAGRQSLSGDHESC